jgi:hypothetical protein
MTVHHDHACRLNIADRGESMAKREKGPFTPAASLEHEPSNLPAEVFPDRSSLDE